MASCNVPNNKKSAFDFCNSYRLGKSHKQPFSDSNTKYNGPLQLIHTDIWGPAPHSSMDGYKYHVYFTDAFSRYTWFYPLVAKSDVYGNILKI